MQERVGSAAPVSGVIPGDAHSRPDRSRLRAGAAVVTGLVVKQHLASFAPVHDPTPVLSSGLELLTAGMAGLVATTLVTVRDNILADEAAAQSRRDEVAVFGRPGGLEPREMLEHVLSLANRQPLRTQGLGMAIANLRRVQFLHPGLGGAALADAMARLGARALVWNRRDVRQLLDAIHTLAVDGLCAWEACAGAIVQLARQYNRASTEQGPWLPGSALPTLFLESIDRAAAAGGLDARDQNRHLIGLLEARFMQHPELFARVVDAAAAALPQIEDPAESAHGVAAGARAAPMLKAIPGALQDAPDAVKAVYLGMRARSSFKATIGTVTTQAALQRVQDADRGPGPWTEASARAWLGHVQGLADTMRPVSAPALDRLVQAMISLPERVCDGDALGEALLAVGLALAPQLSATSAERLVDELVACSRRAGNGSAAQARMRAAQRIAGFARHCHFPAQLAAFDRIPADGTGRKLASLPPDAICAAFAREPRERLAACLPGLRRMMAGIAQARLRANGWIAVVESLSTWRPTPASSLMGRLFPGSAGADAILGRGLLPPAELMQLIEAVANEAGDAHDSRDMVIPRLVQLAQEQASAALVRCAWSALSRLPHFRRPGGDREAMDSAYALACIHAMEHAALRLVPVLTATGRRDNRIPHPWLPSLKLPQALPELRAA